VLRLLLLLKLQRALSMIGRGEHEKEGVGVAAREPSVDGQRIGPLTGIGESMERRMLTRPKLLAGLECSK